MNTHEESMLLLCLSPNLINAKNSVDILKSKQQEATQVENLLANSYHQSKSNASTASFYENEITYYVDTSSYQNDDASISNISNYEVELKAMKFPELMELIRNREVYLETAAIQFTYEHFPPDVSHKIIFPKRETYPAITYSEILTVWKEFHDNWIEAKSEIENYKQKVIENDIEINEIIEHIENFYKKELGDQEHFIEVINFYNNFEKQSLVIEEQKIQTNILFEKLVNYIEDFKTKLIHWDSKDEDGFKIEILKEIEVYDVWFDNICSAVTKEFNKLVTDKISSTIIDVAENSIGVCKNIKEKINELEANIIKKKQSFLNKKCINEENYMLNTIKKILQRKWNLGGLRKLRDIMLKARAELNDTEKDVAEADSILKSEILKVLSDVDLADNLKIEQLKFLNTQNKIKLNRLESNIERIEAGLSKLRTVIKEEINTQKIFTIEFDSDEFGRYYKDEFGQKIYKEEDSDSEYIEDDHRNFVKLHKMVFTISSNSRSEVAPLVSIDDKKYLKTSVGKAVIKGLENICRYQPTDPIEYLALWLLNYRNHKEENKEIKIDVLSHVDLLYLMK